MGMLFCITMMLVYMFTKNDIHLIASCIFAIADSITNVAIAIRKPKI